MPRPKGSGNAITKWVLMDTIKKFRGNVTLTIEHLGIGKATFYKALKRYPELKEAFDGARDEVLDITENKMLEAIERGEPWAISLYLKTIGRVRGYGDVQTIVQSSFNADIDLTKLSQEELENLEKLVTKAASSPASDRSGDM